MNLLTPTAADHWLNLVPVLLHTLWQGALIALLLGGALVFLPACFPRLRYGLSVGALVAVLSAAFLTLAYLDHEVARPQSTAPATSTKSETQPAIQTAAVATPTTTTTSPPLPGEIRPTTDYRAVLLGFWLTGVLAMIGRLALSLHGVDNLRRRCRPCPDQPAIALLEELASRAAGAEHRIRLLTADALEGPVAMGVLWPAIILPAGLATGTSPATVRAILAHEIAHIRRHDYLVNLGQLLIETLLFFNPAVWLISRWIRIEREACCDAMAARLLENKTDYAEALASYAAARKTAPLPALAFSDEKQPSTLADRVRRLLVPGYRPRIRLPLVSLPLVSLAMFLLCGGLLLAALREGSRVAVEVGARLLTPEERIEKIQEIQKTHSLTSEIDYGNVTEDSPKVQIRGRVIDESGNIVTNRYLYANARIERPKSTSVHALNVRDGIVYDELTGGQIWAAATLQGFAPAIVGPLTGRPGSSFTNLTFVLRKGISTRVKLTTPNGRGIPGAVLKGVYDTGIQIALPEATTDANGIAVFTNTLPQAVKLEARTPGYQFDQRRFALSADTVPEWRLLPAQTTVIRVVDRAGKPVPNPRARLVNRTGFASMGYGPDSRVVLAQGGRDGRLKIDSLRDDSFYSLLIEADAYRDDFLHKVYATDTNLVFTLGPVINVSGWFEGDLEALKKRWVRHNGKRQNVPVMNYSLKYRTGEHASYSKGGHAPVDIRNGRAYFTLTNLHPGRLVIHGPEEPFDAELTNSLTGLRLVIAKLSPHSPAEPDLPMRKVRLEFNVPPDQPPARGRLTLKLNLKGQGAYKGFEERAVEVTNNAVEVELTVGSTISAEPGNFTGYWFPKLSYQAVKAGAGPQTFRLNCVPAGAIYGTISETDGSPARGVMISVVPEKKSALQTGFLDVDIKDSSSSSDQTKFFNATPLPLGGVYRIVVHRGPTFVLSGPVAVNREHPLHQVELVLPPGREVTGRIVDESGQPLAGMRFSYSFQAVPGHSHGGSDQFTDRLGRFRFEHVAPPAPERWFINLNDNPGYQRIRLPLDFRGDMEITLRKGRVYEGRVVDRATGWPIPGVEVYALTRPYSPERAGHIDADAKTDNAGRFRFSTMDDGEYQLGVRSGSLPRGLEIKVFGDQTAPVTIPITLHEWSKLSPVKPDARTTAASR